jgi:hypothetical protein
MAGGARFRRIPGEPKSYDEVVPPRSKRTFTAGSLSLRLLFQRLWVGPGAPQCCTFASFYTQWFVGRVVDRNRNYDPVSTGKKADV